ncbi:hypothetical protein SOVF_002930 [Spinacia oleracea]|nr:hypothetical protein SOVF_002930 [Spinacia oleracea]
MANRRSNTLANWVNTSSALATMVFLMSLLKQYAPYQLRRIIYQFTHQLFDVMFTIDEFSPGILPTRNDDFESIQAYLGKNGSKNAKRLRLSSLLGEKRVLTMDANEEMTDKFNGVTLGRNVYHNPDSLWNPVEFNHPATFDTLAMDPEKKREIVADLLKFRDSEAYYSRIGKAWKRDNTQLRSLLINTTSRSIIAVEDIDCSLIAVEDIDCSLSLTGRRDDRNKPNIASTGNSSTNTSASTASRNSSVTISGLLNFADGIWSALGGERIIVFTTNHVGKLDPTLIRAGRMDKHIELSYCGFEAFKLLAKNYLLVTENSKFEVIKALLDVTKMTPADVAENLLPKFPDDDVDICLGNLVCALEKAKKEQEAKAVALEKRRLERKAKEEAEAALLQVGKKADEPPVRVEAQAAQLQVVRRKLMKNHQSRWKHRLQRYRRVRRKLMSHQSRWKYRLNSCG